MKNLKLVLEASDSSLRLVAKTTILLKDISAFGKVNEIYGSYFEAGHYPARATYEVANLPRGSLIEIEAIAVRNPIGDSLKKKIKSE
jgi:2-iminobutanoate/2-iminopropanoate deaminase